MLVVVANTEISLIGRERVYFLWMREWRCRKCWEVIKSVEGMLGMSKVARTWSEENSGREHASDF